MVVREKKLMNIVRAITNLIPQNDRYCAESGHIVIETVLIGARP